MSNFPGKFNFGDIVKFKYRGHGIVEGRIIGCVVSCAFTDKEYVDYQVHSLPDQEPRFFFKSVSENDLIND